MASIILKDPYITFNGHVMAEFLNEVDLDISVDLQPYASFAGEWLSWDAGQKTWVMTFGFIQDFDEDKFDDFMWPLLATLIDVQVRPENALVGRSNPQYAGRAWLEDYPILGAAVGELADGFITMRGHGELFRTIT